MAQHLLAGIVTDLNAERRGQGMDLNVFTLFIGFGLGGFLFGEILRFGFDPALTIFATVMVCAALLAAVVFRRETAKG
ncbi:hypothetical protein [Trichothermofontia sp.]